MVKTRFESVACLVYNVPDYMSRRAVGSSGLNGIINPSPHVKKNSEDHLLCGAKSKALKWLCVTPIEEKI